MIQNGFEYVSRSEFWNYYLKSEDAKYLLQYDVPQELRKKIISEYLTVVNIETSSYCNRKCSYCPVSIHGSRPLRMMDDSLFERLIGEMEEIGFKGQFTFSLFNEPLTDEKLLDRVKYTKSKCPNSYVRMNSNGDYLTRELLDKLVDAGVDEMLLTMHMAPNEVYTDELAKSKLEAFFKKVDVPMEITASTPNHNITCNVIYRTMRFLVVTNNWAEDGCDRGGEMENLSLDKRLDPCPTSYRELIVDVDGDLRPCWNAYITAPAVLNVKDTTLVDAYFSKELVDFRRDHLLWNEKSGICEGCNTPDNSDRATEEIRKTLLK